MENVVKTVLVTGGTRGIGKAIVKEFASGNARVGKCNVAFTYKSCDECANEIVKDFEKETKILPIKTDASSFEGAVTAVEKVINEFGKLDFLVNNAGITKDNLLLRMSEDDFDQVLSINAKSVFNYTKACSKQFIKQRHGKIVNISSVVGLIGNPGQANYAASKAAIIGFSKSIAKELSSRNINVNVIAPGFIETEMTGNLNDKQREVLLSNIPLKRMGKPEDIAKVVAFLCSDDANYITGQVITVDGGMVM